MSTKVAVLGNGESRKDLNLNLISQSHTLIGCNALHRDYSPDYLICCDRRMVKEALQNQQLKTKLYTRKEWIPFFKDRDIYSLPELPFIETERWLEPINWNSGPYAVLLACELGFEQIELFGFDLYHRGKSNNIYKGTENYNLNPIDPSYWILQLSMLFEIFSDRKFLIHNLKDWIIPLEWKKLNVKFLAL